jgi:methylamine dehydrogenase accessory protein MauD
VIEALGVAGIVLTRVAAVFALAWQVGNRYERRVPVGPLTRAAGPQLGDLAPGFEQEDLGERGTARIGGADATSTLLLFLSPTCPVCKKLLPILKSTQQSEQAWLRIVLASDGPRDEQKRFRQSAKLELFPFVLAAPWGWRVRSAACRMRC